MILCDKARAQRTVGSPMQDGPMRVSRTPNGGIGVFRSRTTRDASAQDRDGEMFFEANPLDERIPSPEGDLFEARFADGVWILARTPDLTFFY